LWDISSDGKADKWIPASSTESNVLEQELLFTWKFIENLAATYTRFARFLVRCVTLDRLVSMEEWEPRRRWLEEEGNIYVPIMECMHSRSTCNGLLEFLVLLEYHNPDAYTELQMILRRHLPGCSEDCDLSLMVISLFGSQCSCQRRHQDESDIFSFFDSRPVCKTVCIHIFKALLAALQALRRSETLPSTVYSENKSLFQDLSPWFQWFEEEPGPWLLSSMQSSL